jgi:hypothetical protein
MFVYCVERLNFSEDAAATRIRVARAARQFPLMLRYFESGKIHLTGMRLLCPHLTEDNHRELLKRASHRSKKQVEELCVVELAPRAARTRYGSQTTGTGSDRDSEITCSGTCCEAGSGGTAPAGRSASATENQCTYEDEMGRRCRESATLEYDHIKPSARGGQTTFDNLRLRCKAHNLLSAEDASPSIHKPAPATDVSPHARAAPGGRHSGASGFMMFSGSSSRLSA